MNPINSTPFYFKIHPITSYIDLSKIYILTECRIHKIAEDGVDTDLEDTDVVSTIQMPGATWIKDLKVLINQREVYTSNQLYAYKTYFDTELSISPAAKDSHLQLTGYYRDVKDPDDVNDQGYIGRKNRFAKSKKVQMISKLSADIMNQNLYLIRLSESIFSLINFYLLSNVEVDLEITPNNSDFMIIQQKIAGVNAAQKKFRFEITDVRLLVKTIDIMDGLSLSIARKLDTEPARYGIRKTFMKSLFISAGRTDFSANLFTEEYIFLYLK